MDMCRVVARLSQGFTQHNRQVLNKVSTGRRVQKQGAPCNPHYDTIYGRPEQGKTRQNPPNLHGKIAWPLRKRGLSSGMHRGASPDAIRGLHSMEGEVSATTDECPTQNSVSP